MRAQSFRFILFFALTCLQACNEKFVLKGGFINGGGGSGSTTTIGPSFAGRAFHTATTLATGKILIVGGENNDETLDLVELYDPATDTLTEKAPLNMSRSEHTATLLGDGKVLVVGGYNSDNSWNPVNSVEIYDPAADSWTVIDNLPDPRCNHTSIALNGNRVLVTGGYDINWDYTDTAYIYDAGTGNWSVHANMTFKRTEHTLALLPNGKIMAIGGDSGLDLLQQHEIYDPDADFWSFTEASSSKYAYHDSVVLPNNKVMVFGGHGNAWSLNSTVEFYDYATDTWSSGAPLPVATAVVSAGLLANNKVVMAGGTQVTGRSDDLFIYDYLTDIWTTSGNLNEARRYHTLSIVGNDVIVTGGQGTSGILKSVERFSYDGSTWDFVIAPPKRVVSINPPANGNYTDGMTMSFSLTFDAPVTLTGSVTMPIYANSGSVFATATSSGSSLTHTFELAVDASMISDGIQIGGTMDLNGGTLVETSTNTPADLYVVNESFADVALNYQRPEIISIVAPAPGPYYEGYELEFTVTFSEPVTVTGTPYIWLEVGSGGIMLTSQTTGSSAVHLFKSYPIGNEADLDGIVMQGTLNIAGADTVLSDSGIPAKTTFTPPDVSGIVIPPRGAMNFNRSPGSYIATKLSDNRLVVVGGFDAGTFTAINHVEIFNPLTNSWTVLAPLNQARGLQKVHELPNGNLVVFGGIGANSATPIFDSTEVYDMVANTWTTVMPMSTPRYHPASILMTNGRILVMGGYTTGLACVDSVEEFDPLTNTWSNKPAMSSGTQTSMTLVELPNGSISKTAGQCWGVSRGDEIYVP